MISCHILTWAWGVRLNLYHDHLWALPALPLRCREVDASHDGEGFCVEEKPTPLHLGPDGSSCIDLFPLLPPDRMYPCLSCRSSALDGLLFGKKRRPPPPLPLLIPSTSSWARLPAPRSRPYPMRFCPSHRHFLYFLLHFFRGEDNLDLFLRRWLPPL